MSRLPVRKSPLPRRVVLREGVPGDASAHPGVPDALVGISPGLATALRLESDPRRSHARQILFFEIKEWLATPGARDGITVDAAPG